MTDENVTPSGAIAVVGMALRVPGAATPEAFWRNLRDGVESISRFTAEELLAAGAGPQDLADPRHVPAFGALAGIEDFDAGLFGFAPREAQLLDPQHRLFLECAWEALEHAGHPADTAQEVIGVYGGVGESSYLLKSLLAHPGLVERIGAFQTSLGNDKDFAPTRVSYKLDLTGPSVSVQTGCSTSLVAVHLAAQALLSGECDLALAGGATVDVLQRRGYRYEPGGVMSADGHCRAFDAAASGAVPASGAGIVVLKRLADALDDGDLIHAVIRGSAINNDGARKVGFTAPSVDGQADVIAEALAIGDVDPATISYIEAHGTGTPLGDPIEVAALTSVFGDAAGPGAIALGSVKTNVGHLDTAAGVVGLIKTVLAMKARELPPSLHLREPNPRLELESGPFRIATELQPWRAPVLRAGVSSFGIGGTNAHVVLEQAPAVQAVVRPQRRRPRILALSAATPAALKASAAQLREHLKATADQQHIDDVAFTLQSGRWALPYRHFVVAADAQEAVDALDPPAPVTTEAADATVAFTFPGQGAQCIDAGLALYQGQPVFRDALDQIAELFIPHLGTDLRHTLYPDADRRAEATERITRTDFAQPALFAVEYAVAQLWLSWGVQPVALLGHSIGELTAACLAGVFSLQDAVRLVAARGRLMHAAAPGEMLAVPLPEAEVAGLLGDELSLAAVNGPRQCAVSGPAEPVAAFAAACAERGIEVKRLKTSHAFHSASMDQAADTLAAEFAQVQLSAPQIPFVSNVTGTWITEEQATSPAYWAQQLRSTVRFQDGLVAVREVAGTLLEVGPGRVLTALSGSAQPGAAVASLPSAFAGGDAERDVLSACGQLWCLGVSVAWQAIGAEASAEATPRRTELPTYPFQRERCWVDAPRSGSTPVSGQPGGLSVRAFTRTAPAAATTAGTASVGPGAWLVRGENALLGPVEQRLRDGGVRVVTVDGEQDIAGVVYALPSGGDIGSDIGRGDVLAPIRELAQLRALNSGARFVVLTTGVLDVTGEERIDPRAAALSEWARQDPNGARMLVDAYAPASPAAVQRLAGLIWAEIAAVTDHPVVALRGGHRFVPASAPLPATDRAADQRYALMPPKNSALAASFDEALAQGGTTLCDISELSPAEPGTALILLDSADGARACAHSLFSAAAATNALGAERVRACEVHIVAPAEQDLLGSCLVAAIEAQVARLGREAAVPWTSFVWPSAAALAAPDLAASAVGSTRAGCAVVVSAPELAGDLSAGHADGDSDVPGYEDEIERTVAAIFTDLLGIREIPVTSGFFELGGHSLLAAQLVAHVRRECEVDVLLSEFIDEPTIRGLARAVRRAREAARPLEQLPTVVADPAAADQPFPLTDVQQAYWIGRTGVFDLGNVGMHGYEEYDAPGMDLPRLQDALRKLIARQGMLRVVFLPDGEQRILSEVPDYVIATEDARGLSRQEADALTERTRATMSHQVFAPERWPLFEMRATLLDDDVTRVHFSVDGLITDAWAFQLMLSELVHLYQHPDVALPELELSFRDYVLAEQSLESTERYRRATEYWQERIPDLALAPDLPLACDPGSIGAPRFERLSGELSEPEWTRIKALAAGRNLTPTALLLTAYSEVLATWSKQRRFTLNLPMANRLPLHPQVEQIIGDFTSVTLLEVDAGGEATFEARASAVRDRLVSDLDHRLYSGVKVLRELKRRRGDAAASMPVVFTSLFTNHGGDPQLGEVVYSISQTPQIWIDAQVFEAAGALVLDIDSVEGLFPDGMVRAIHGATLDLLRRLAEDEALWSRPVPILVPRAELAQREEYNRTEGPIPGGLMHEAFFAAAAAAPDRPAIITPDRTLDYGELAGHALAVASALRGLVEPAPGDLVAVVMEKGWEQCAAVLGVHAAGAAYLPIDPELPAERIENLLEYSRARAVLTQSWLVDGGRVELPGELPVLSVDTLAVQAGAADLIGSTDLVGAVRPEDLAYVIFTSGSTGQPKGVMIDHRGARNTIADINERFGVTREDRVLGLSSLSFDLSVYDVFGPLSMGAALVLPGADRQRDPAAWRELMTSARVTVWNSVPALMELLVEHLAMQEATLPALRLAMLSGDWIPVTLPARIRRVAEAAQVVSLGGATEASIWSILYPIGEVPEDWTSIPYGRPMRNQTFHVLDSALRPRPVGVPGQMYIGGVGVAMGYLRDGVRTKASFIVHPDTGERLYRTGDLGRFLPSGEIEFLGREDFQVKVQGYRIELGEIEAALVQHPAIRAAVVVADGAPRGAKRLVAFVVLQDDEDSGVAPTVLDLREFLGAKLPQYMVPGVFVDLDALPLTANGKVDRRALDVPREAAEAAHGYEAPGTRIEEIVTEVWSNLLRLERVGVHDDFFDIGGDSLLAMRAVVHLRKALDIELSIHVLFDRRTPRELSLAVEDLLLAEIEAMTS